MAYLGAIGTGYQTDARSRVGFAISFIANPFLPEFLARYAAHGGYVYVGSA